MKRSRRKVRPLDAQAPDAFRRQHGGIASRRAGKDEIAARFVNESESPLLWLARRKGPDGSPYVDPTQFAAGEQLRADFTRAGLTPRVTANWIAPVAQGRRAGGGDAAAQFADAVIAAKERVRRALASAGPEFSGLLLDICCFLKGLEQVERERRWPPRTARIVLSLALDRLARHYGISAEARGPARARTRAWQAPDARPTIDGN
jgi:hypothetical protein